MTKSSHASRENPRDGTLNRAQNDLKTVQKGPETAEDLQRDNQHEALSQ